MTKEQAVNVLHEQLKKLEDKNQPNDYWLAITKKALKIVFGKSSIYYKNFVDVNYVVIRSQGAIISITKEGNEKAKRQLKEVVKEAIDALPYSLGTFQDISTPLQQSWFRRKWEWLVYHKSWGFWGVVIAAIGLVLYILSTSNNNTENNAPKIKNSVMQAPKIVPPEPEGTSKKNQRFDTLLYP